MHLRPAISVYLGHVLSSEGIHRGPKVSALNEMPAPHDVSTLRSFLGSVQFYAKFLLPTLLQWPNRYIVLPGRVIGGHGGQKRKQLFAG